MTREPHTRRVLSASVDLDQLACVLDGDPNRYEGGYLDLTTGETWPTFVFEDDEDFDPEDERWYYVPCQGSGQPWQDMREFIDEQVVDVALATRFGDAIQGRGAFRRFRDLLRHHPDIASAWLHFRDERARTRALDWLLDERLVDPA